MKVLIAFYENRLKDHYVVTPPVLQGLKALVSLYLLDFQGTSSSGKHRNCQISLTVNLFFRVSGVVVMVSSHFLFFLSRFFLPDKEHNVASWLSCGHAEGSFSGYSCSGETLYK